MDSLIRLELPGTSLQITFLRGFLSENPPRKNDEVIETGRSSYGTFFSKRRVTEEYHKWEFEHLISDESRRILDSIFWEHNRRIRSKTTDPQPDLIITDCTREFSELWPRTRAIAASPHNVETTYGSPLFVSYYAKFYGWFFQEPQYTKMDEKYRVSIVLIESKRKVPLNFDGL